MKYYIATTISNAPSHNRVRDALTPYGYEITYDWTTHGSVKMISKERLQEVALNETEGIDRADFLLVLFPGGIGTHVELGYALAQNKQVFLHSEDPSLFELGPQTCAFYHLPQLTLLTCSLPDLAPTLHRELVAEVPG